MGFLSAWDQTERIDVSDLAGDLPETWWIDVKKCLTHSEADAVMRELMNSTIKIGDPTQKGSAPVKTSITTDAVADQQSSIVLRSIVGWNLTDDADEILPFEVDESLDDPYAPLKRSLALLPSPVYDRVAKVVVAANTETSAESGSFRADSSRSDEAGNDYAPDDSEVLV